MDALKNIINNVPEWTSKLDTLIEEIDKRQIELAQCAENGEDAPDGSIEKEKRVLKHKGSTESLRPADEDAERKPEEDEEDELLSPRPHALTSEAIARASTRAIQVAHARARAQVRAKERSASVASVEEEGKPQTKKYRSSRMIKVYYDSFVQTFFEELVKFVSASRNLIRKAKMTAKVAHIKRVAEMESQDESASGNDPLLLVPGANYIAARIPTHSLRYNPNMNFNRSMGPRSPGLNAARNINVMGGARNYDMGFSRQTDAYDRLDKALEFVQSQSERGAHQFLRDGDCSEEIHNISKRMVEARELASKEFERIMAEEPELARDTGEVNKVRTHRPTLMRREFIPSKPALAHQASLQSLRAGGPPISSYGRNVSILQADS